MNAHRRIEMVKAMELIARNINDEEVFESWLMCGVADGDGNDLDDPDVNESYIDDDSFKGLMECFVRMMFNAAVSGGLYCDDIVTTENIPSSVWDLYHKYRRKYIRNTIEELAKDRDIELSKAEYKSMVRDIVHELENNALALIDKELDAKELDMKGKI